MTDDPKVTDISTPHVGNPGEVVVTRMTYGTLFSEETAVRGPNGKMVKVVKGSAVVRHRGGVDYGS
jgi:hypothetical protein